MSTPLPMHESAEFLELLRREGIVREPEARLTALTGGVSCEIYLVEDGAERFVVKRALAKLKVKADWFADVNRNRYEWEFIQYVARFLPEAVPALASGLTTYFGYYNEARTHQSLEDRTPAEVYGKGSSKRKGRRAF